MTIPTISINGSTKKMLVEDLCEAQHKLYEAIAAFKQCCPHPRDYQTAKDGEYGKARTEYLARHAKLQEVHDELQEMAIKIHESAPDAR